MSKKIKKIASFALPIIGSLAAPGIGTALGSTLSSATLAGIGGAVGGAAGGGLSGNGLKGVLTGAAMGGAGGYLSGGGFSDLLSGTSLGNGLNSITNSIGLGNVIGSPAAETARTAVSSAATSAAPSSNFLSGYLPGGGSAAAGGGSSGGFLSSLLGSGGADIASNGLQVGKVYDFTNTPWLTDVFSGGVKNAFTDYGAVTGVNAATNGASNMLSSNFLKGALKTAVPYFLEDDNASGYQQVQNAARDAAANYQPFMASGQAANKKLSDFYGLNGPDATAAALGEVQNLPGFQFARDQGIRSLDASAASRGMLRSGNQEQAVQDFGTSLAMQYVQQYLDNLQNQQRIGLGATDGVNSGNMTAADAYAELKQRKADRRNQALGVLSNFL